MTTTISAPKPVTGTPMSQSMVLINREGNTFKRTKSFSLENKERHGGQPRVLSEEEMAGNDDEILLPIFPSSLRCKENQRYNKVATKDEILPPYSEILE